MATLLDKRRRNSRPSKYRPRTEAQKRRRQELRDARSDERKARETLDAEADLLRRLADLETALRDAGQDGVHLRRHARPLADIEDDAQRFSVLKARVERLEALWAINRRKRETRGKIILGGAILAELVEAITAGEPALLAEILDILDRRVDGPRDRLTVRELLGNAPLPLRPGGDVLEPMESVLEGVFSDAPDFDFLVQSAMAEEAVLRPGDVDDDYADVADTWRPADHRGEAPTTPSAPTNRA
jgi:hypothetical protein